MLSSRIARLKCLYIGICTVAVLNVIHHWMLPVHVSLGLQWGMDLSNASIRREGSWRVSCLSLRQRMDQSVYYYPTVEGGSSSMAHLQKHNS